MNKTDKYYLYIEKSSSQVLKTTFEKQVATKTLLPFLFRTEQQNT